MAKYIIAELVNVEEEKVVGYRVYDSSSNSYEDMEEDKILRKTVFHSAICPTALFIKNAVSAGDLMLIEGYDSNPVYVDIHTNRIVDGYTAIFTICDFTNGKYLVVNYQGICSEMEENKLKATIQDCEQLFSNIRIIPAASKKERLEIPPCYKENDYVNEIYSLINDNMESLNNAYSFPVAGTIEAGTVSKESIWEYDYANEYIMYDINGKWLFIPKHKAFDPIHTKAAIQPLPHSILKQYVMERMKNRAETNDESVEDNWYEEIGNNVDDILRFINKNKILSYECEFPDDTIKGVEVDCGEIPFDIYCEHKLIYPRITYVIGTKEICYPTELRVR